MKLTQKQKVFCEEYIKTGNASDAARKAGYSPKTAPFIGAENLKKPQISAYIKSRLDEQDAALVADANEVLRFYSAVMRGEIRDQFGLDPSLADIIEFITGVFTGDWEQAWEGVKKIFKGIWNSIIMIVESAINLIIKGINWMISKLNTIHFEIPDWVPIIGGKSFGINISPVSEVKLPRLATGAVIPPNREFLAVLGDQKSGTNIETPLATMVQAFRQALADGGYSGGSEAVLVLDKEVLGKVIYKLNKAEGNRIGVNLAGV